MMNIAIDLFTFLLFGLLIIVSILLVGLISKNNLPLPPGPWKLPLIGNIHQLIGKLPHRRLRDLAKKYGPIMHLQIGQLSYVIVSSPEIAKQVFHTHDGIFVFRDYNISTQIISYNCKNIAFCPCGDYWRRVRRICNLELLSPKSVQAFRPIRQEQTSNLIRWIASNEGKPINLTEKVYSLLYTTTAMAAFGKKNEDQESFQKLVNQFMKISIWAIILDMYPSIKFIHSVSGLKASLERKHSEIDMILQKIINEHRNTAKDVGAADDFVDVLLKHGEENVEFHLTEEEIKAILLDIFVGGSDTAATTTDWAMSEMMKHPSILKRAQEEVRQAFGSDGYVDEKQFKDLRYIRSIIKETLRLHPPAPVLLPRLNTQRVEINGYEIPANTRFVVNAWAISTDPTYWKDSECFQPERFLDSLIDFKGKDFEYIPFGAGRRICPGIENAWANVIFPIVHFLYYFDWELPDGRKCEDLNMKEELGMTVRRKDDLYIIPTIRIPLPC